MTERLATKDKVRTAREINVPLSLIRNKTINSVRVGCASISNNPSTIYIYISFRCNFKKKDDGTKRDLFEKELRTIFSEVKKIDSPFFPKKASTYNIFTLNIPISLSHKKRTFVQTELYLNTLNLTDMNNDYELSDKNNHLHKNDMYLAAIEVANRFCDKLKFDFITMKK